MKIINDTPYDTRMLRTIVCAAYRALVKTEGKQRWWPIYTVKVAAGRRRGIMLQAFTDEMRLWLPALDGTEWIAVARRAQGNAPPTNVSLPAESANVYRHALWALMYASSGYRTALRPADLNVRGMPKTLPEFVPLKVVRPARPRDVARERYERVLVLERAWVRKAKLAQTKLKKVRRRRRYYEKRLAARKEET